MDAFFTAFQDAHVIGSGYQVSATLLPLNTPERPHRLLSFYRSTNAQSVKADIEYQIKYGNKVGLPKKEIPCWVDIYIAYWKAVGEILKAEESTEKGFPVRNIHFSVFNSVSRARHIRGCSTRVQASLPCVPVLH